MIIAGSNLTRNSQNTRCPNNDTLFNYGTFTTDRSINGQGTSSFYNGGSGTLNIQRVLHTTGTVIASETGNTINYNRTGSNNQTIKETFDGYYNLTIDGNNINSDKNLVAGTVVLNDFTINASTFRHADTFSLYVGGDFSLVSGDYQNDGGRLVFNGSTPQSITGDLSVYDVVVNNSAGVAISSDTMRLSGHMTVPDGTLTTNNRLIVISDALRDAAIGEIGSTGLVDGDVIVNRYIDQGGTNWRFMSSPTTNATFTDWKDDFDMAGFPGSHFPNFHFTSVYGYDESIGEHQDSGFFTIGITDQINPGEGYWVFCGDSLNGTDPFTIDVTGPINQGQFDFLPTYTVSAGLAQDGWNLIANPYPSAIDWDDASWTKTNMDSAVYIWNTDVDQYSSYLTGGASVNGGSNIIPMGQAFYVKANLLLPQLILEESAKYDTTVSFLRKERIEDLIVRLKVVQGDMTAESLIRVVPASTNAFDARFDAYHFRGIGDNKTAIYSETEPQLSINSMPAESSELVQLRVAGIKGLAKVAYEIERYKDDFCVIYIDPRSGDQILLDQHQGEIEVEFEESEVDQPIQLLIVRQTSSSASACQDILSTNEVDVVDSDPYYGRGTIYFNSVYNHSNEPFKVISTAGIEVLNGLASESSINVSFLAPGVYFLDFMGKKLKFVHL
jgi:hypothetical protein